MAKLSQHCKYLHLVYTSNLSGPLFHTSRNPIIPNIARGENYNAPDYLYCLRPAKLPEADASNLAGEPRSTAQLEGIKCPMEKDDPPQFYSTRFGCDVAVRPEVYHKWNQRPKQDIYKEWTKLAVFY